MTWSVLDGDCLERLADLDGDSIDAVVTDPPYGLSAEPDAAEVFRHWLSGDDYQHRGGGFMGKSWDSFVPGPTVWKECLRVLKPGGHLVAFFGTRTVDLGGMAIRLAGFEIRDCLAWHYGSGFPKSLDVSKAIDRRRYDLDEVYTVTGWIREARDAAGIGNREIDQAFGFSGMAGHWTSSKSQPAVPTLDQVPKLLEVLGVEPEDVPEEIRRLLYDLNGVAGEPGENWWKREVVGEQTKARSEAGLSALPTLGAEVKYETWNLTAPATDLARQWQGWGTALKPAFEPIILARKPLIGTVAENVTRFGTGALNVDGCRVEYQGESDRPTQEEWNRKGSSGAAGANGFAGQFSQGMKDAYADGKIPVSPGRWPANLVLDDQAAAMLDEQSGETVSRFFASFDSSTMDQCPQPGERSTKDANTSAGRRAEKNAVDSPTDGSGNKNTDRSRPATTSTTETTTRSTTTSKTSNSSSADDTNDITVNSEPPKSSETESADARSVENGNLSSTSTQGQPDHDRQSAENVVAHTSENGESETGSGTTPICANTANGTQPQTRFFYQAKASRAERNAGLDGFEPGPRGDLNKLHQNIPTGSGNPRNNLLANVHPTVKPIDLMRWLVRLVTPPGGTVLDPFTGSGTTGIAAGLEGFDFVGIEREAEYREIAEARLRWWGEQEGETSEILQRAGLAEKERAKAEAAGQTSLFEEAA